MIRRVIAALILLLSATAAAAQVPFPQTLPANTVYGRLGISAGPGQAIPFGTLSGRLGNITNVLSFGAVCDGVTDDTNVIAAAMATYVPVQTPVGRVCKVTTSAAALSGRIFGFGQIKDGANNFRGPFFGTVSANVAYTATNEDSPDTAFNAGGGFARSQFPVEHRITGAATLTQPTSGYVYSPWAYPHYTYFYNESGWNNSTSTNDGRTAAVANRIKVHQAGQGDAVAFNCTGIVTTAKGGATNFAANPAVSCFNGDVFAFANGAYLNPFEVQLHDSGFDAAGIAVVSNLERTNNTAALGVGWGFLRGQSIGSKAIDFGLSITGPVLTGLDFSQATFTASQIGAAFPANARIYLNSTSSGFFTVLPGNVYLDYNSSATGFDFVMANNSPSLRLTTVATPVNFVNIQGQATGVPAVISSDGSDSAVDFLYTTKGGATTHRFRTNGSGGPTQFTISDTASATRNINVTGSNGGNPTISTTAGNLAITPAVVGGSYLQTGLTTVGALPACAAGTKGARFFVTDNNTALAFAAVITTGGAIQTPVYCDGTTWRQG